MSGAIDIVNNGPSTVYWGRFKFVITAAAESMLFVDGPTASGAGISACRSTAAPKTFATSVTIECDLRNMRPEAKAVVSFNLIVSIGSSGFGSLRYNREVVSSADDPDSKNNVHTNTILLCTDNATNSACA